MSFEDNDDVERDEHDFGDDIELDRARESGAYGYDDNGLAQALRTAPEPVGTTGAWHVDEPTVTYEHEPVGSIRTYEPEDGMYTEHGEPTAAAYERSEAPESDPKGDSAPEVEDAPHTPYGTAEELTMPEPSADVLVLANIVSAYVMVADPVVTTTVLAALVNDDTSPYSTAAANKLVTYLLERGA